jgi:N-acyl homoserine lactone hydrolase
MAEGRANKVWGLDGAVATVEASALVVGQTGQVRIPFPTFLVEHPRGLVLVDTGLAPEAVGRPNAFYGAMAAAVDFRFEREHCVDRQILMRGYRVEDVTDVVITHAHIDHTGGIRMFPHARLHIGALDLAYALHPAPEDTLLYRADDFTPTLAQGWNTVRRDHDLLGDGAIVLLQMPGHTPGNLSVLVRLADRTVLLSGDTVHLQVALDDELYMHGDFDEPAAVTSVRRLKEIARAEDAVVWIAHDPQQWERFRVPSGTLL